MLGVTIPFDTPIKVNIPISFVAHLGLARQYLKMFNCDKQIAKQIEKSQKFDAHSYRRRRSPVLKVYFASCIFPDVLMFIICQYFNDPFLGPLNNHIYHLTNPTVKWF